MVLQSSFFDPVLGLDLHILGVPVPPAPVPVPTPFPLPFVGMVFDPLGLAIGAAIGMATGGGPAIVLINSMPVTNCGTEVTNKLTMPHVPIPPGVMFIPPPMPGNDAELFFGSLNVSLGGTLGVRLGDIALSCNDPVRLPTSMVLAIPKGMPVLNMPAMVPDAKAIAMAVAMRVASKALGALARRGAALFRRVRGANFFSRVSHALGGCHPPSEASRWRQMWSRAVRVVTGHPVDVVTGNLFTDAVDASLPGPLPLVIERVYESAGSAKAGALGYGWSHSLDESLWLERGRVVVRLGDGREVEFGVAHLPGRAMAVGDVVDRVIHKLRLQCVAPGHYELTAWDTGRVHEFAPVGGGAPGVARLVRIRSRDGHHAIELSYDAAGRLARARDVGGRVVRFVHDDLGRLVTLELPSPDGHGWYAHRRYRYDAAGDLVDVSDSSGASYRYHYQGHLLVQETNRVGLSFYFQYDSTGSIAKCVRTWGDGGIYDHVITYDGHNRRTTVENSLGAVTVYAYNERNQVEKVTDALGGATVWKHDPGTGVTVLEVDPVGASTHRTVDARGNLLSVTDPIGATSRYAYNALDLVVEMVDAAGHAWTREYDPHGRLVVAVDALGNAYRYHHDDRGYWVAASDPLGRQRRWRYDERGDLIESTDWEGHATLLKHDALGRLVQLRDPMGAVMTATWDSHGRVVAVTRADGTVERMAYDANGNLVEYLDAQERVTRYRRRGMDRVAERIDPAGGVVRLEYDTEENLVGVVNEHDERYRFELDPLGRVVTEVGFDGRTQEYGYDAAGRTVETTNHRGQRTVLARDALGRLSTRRAHDGREARYEYAPGGGMTLAANAECEVRFVRDAVGRVVREEYGGHRVESRYNAVGDRVGRTTSLGHETHYDFDANGRLRALTLGPDPRWMPWAPGTLDGAPRARPPWTMSIERNARGEEVARRLPGGVVSSWESDVLGRPVSHTIRRSGEALLATGYRWRATDEIAMLVDAARGPTRFEHDLRGHLTAARYPDGSVQHRSSDAVGNVFRTADRSGRVYGAGGVLREADGARYTHDRDGQRVEWVLPSGERWRYAWDSSDQLRAVTRPDGSEVTFAYDALGRRVQKATEGRRTRWIWDGDDVVHELVEGKSGATWVTDPGRFAPLAKVEGGRCFGVVIDHLGTPTALFDEAGDLAWQARLDVYGVALTEVAATACPWRWPGQYEDDETGLYYNRFRYYDPATGRYVSQDPIGLLGGMRAYPYVPDPLTWLDELGLKECNSRRDAFRSARRDAGIPIGQHPFRIETATMRTREGDAILNPDGLPIDTREYYYRRGDRSVVVIQEHSAGHQFGQGGVGDQGPHFNARPLQNTRTGKVPGTDEHYSW